MEKGMNGRRAVVDRHLLYPLSCKSCRHAALGLDGTAWDPTASKKI